MNTDKLTTYAFGLDSDNKQCLINKIGADLFEIIHECRSGLISAKFSALDARAMGFSTVRVLGKIVYAKQSTVNRFMAQMNERKRKQAQFTF